MRRWRSVEQTLREGGELPPTRLPGELTGGVIVFAVAAVVLAAVLFAAR